MNGTAIRTFPSLEGMDAIEPNATRFLAKGIKIGQGRHMATGIPFLAIDGAGMATDADIKIDDEAQAPCRGFGGKRGHEVIFLRMSAP